MKVDENSPYKFAGNPEPVCREPSRAHNAFFLPLINPPQNK